MRRCQAGIVKRAGSLGSLFGRQDVRKPVMKNITIKEMAGWRQPFNRESSSLRWASTLSAIPVISGCCTIQ